MADEIVGARPRGLQRGWRALLSLHVMPFVIAGLAVGLRADRPAPLVVAETYRLSQPILSVRAAEDRRGGRLVVVTADHQAHVLSRRQAQVRESTLAVPRWCVDVGFGPASGERLALWLFPSYDCPHRVVPQRALPRDDGFGPAQPAPAQAQAVNLAIRVLRAAPGVVYAVHGRFDTGTTELTLQGGAGVQTLPGLPVATGDFADVGGELLITADGRQDGETTYRAFGYRRGSLHEVWRARVPSRPAAEVGGDTAVPLAAAVRFSPDGEPELVVADPVAGTLQFLRWQATPLQSHA